jgi:hypothetical protein
VERAYAERSCQRELVLLEKKVWGVFYHTVHKAGYCRPCRPKRGVFQDINKTSQMLYVIILYPGRGGESPSLFLDLIRRAVVVSLRVGYDRSLLLRIASGTRDPCLTVARRQPQPNTVYEEGGVTALECPAKECTCTLSALGSSASGLSGSGLSGSGSALLYTSLKVTEV